MSKKLYDDTIVSALYHLFLYRFVNVFNLKLFYLFYYALLMT